MTVRPDEAPARLTDAQVGEVLALARDADSVELKLTVPDSYRRQAAIALGVDPLDAQIRQVYFFDTPDLALNRVGVVVRARRVQGRGDDSVVKLRPVTPADVEPERSSDDMVVEVDAMPGGFVCSASMKGTLGPKAVKEVASGSKGIRTLFSKGQRRFYAAHAPDGLGLDDLSVLGPITVFKLKLRPPELSMRLVAELWFYPDGSRIVELSAKAPPSEAFQAAAELRAFLAGKGLDVSGEQQTKTKTALEFFSAELSGDPGATPAAGPG
ncbi:adenylate cyclase [Nocardioides sp. zg-1230]|uniref:adenylate cyclase n=1 Tax=Nocardioides sp. zg-1230 TaxID=2736601 RepID=UPI0015545220|nr:adenylate cyclase [Nocardioides sp. zg-1230]NPC42584.1 adenylate cyclase [Nocardioides sp. zg-1230]